ncbi:GDSL esterase/lipase At5g55050-like [Zingiber officinale]|uniref:GDSL esterase/lipase n=1 Tax=Zingiber officinale TaxID=94328 RepID=A0A8J5H3M8_ZINOF|nr:GDSL esterase/lipase At5g55050-like [Zingiber officinale]XP_042473995.1 GDSL esterase/lipase At5g55050-like [Zingiber officinale]KAG6517898.1 hypothetical protein ZIOFF_021297 [Zingiber officinale]
MAYLSPAAAAGFATLLVLCWCGIGCRAAPPPAIYVFGDSLVDVGNNNYLSFSLLKANFPHNGIDYPGHKATGRFCNGKNSADSLAEKLGLASPPAYLSLPSKSNNTDAFLGGLNFASGGAGTLDSTNRGKCLTMNKQIDYYTTVYGALAKQLGTSAAQTHLSDSIFVVVIGSNDILNYVGSDSANKLKTPGQQLVDSMVASLQGQLKTIYNLGARKLAVIGTGAIGCSPAQRHQNKTGDCRVEANFLASQFNKGVSSMLEQLEAELTGLSYSFFDTYAALTDIINDPSSYGFVEIKAACCGLGNLNANFACTPISSYCSNRRDHVFWDFYHPTEAAAGTLTSAAFDGSEGYAHPISIKQLAAL